MRADLRSDRNWTSRFRAIFDVLLPVMLIASSIGVLWLTLPRWWGDQHVSSAAVASDDEAPPRQPSTLGPPPTPQSLEGAELFGDVRTARVAIIEYSDFECHFCATFSRQTWPRIRKEYVDPGKVLQVLRPVASSHREFAKNAARSAMCAAKQGKFWQMHDRLFEAEGRLDSAVGSVVAKKIGLNLAAFDDCMKDEADTEIRRNVEIARSIGVAGTPTFLVGLLGRDGNVTITHVLQGMEPYERFKVILDELLHKAALAS